VRLYSSDGTCDDGGAGAKYSLCAFGSNCTDCGARDTTAPSPSLPVDSAAATGVIVGLTLLVVVIVVVARRLSQQSHDEGSGPSPSVYCQR
jgi:hypothetical protein